MSQRRKPSKPQTSAANESPMPRLGPRLIVLALACAIIGGFLAYLVMRDPAQPPPRTEVPVETEQQKADAPSGTFRFYDLLVESEVPVDVEPDPERPKDDRKVFLQVASFRSAADAEQAKVQLLMMNLNPVIETRGDWHRIIVGPFDNQRTQFRVQDQLVQNGFQYLELRR